MGSYEEADRIRKILDAGREEMERLIKKNDKRKKQLGAQEGVKRSIPKPDMTEFEFGRYGKTFKHIGVPNSSEDCDSGYFIESTYTQALDYFHSMKGKTLERSANQHQFGKLFDDGNLGFKGGTFCDLKRPADLTGFEEAKKKVQKSKMLNKIKAVLRDQTVRRRRSDAHDGEYDLDKKWEVNPFSKASRGKSPHRFLKINAHVSFSGFVSAAQIDKYGAMVAAICNVLESSGIGVEIDFISSGRSNIVGWNNYFEDRIKLKSLHEYLPPNVLIKAFSSNFYRRVCFSRDVMLAELHDQDVAAGLGTPCKYKAKVTWKKGEVSIYSESITDNQDRLFEDIEKAIGLV